MNIVEDFVYFEIIQFSRCCFSNFFFRSFEYFNLWFESTVVYISNKIISWKTNEMISIYNFQDMEIESKFIEKCARKVIRILCNFSLTFGEMSKSYRTFCHIRKYFLFHSTHHDQHLIHKRYANSQNVTKDDIFYIFYSDWSRSHNIILSVSENCFKNKVHVKLYYTWFSVSNYQ